MENLYQKMNGPSEGLTRRGFISGALAGATAVGGMGMLAMTGCDAFAASSAAHADEGFHAQIAAPKSDGQRNVLTPYATPSVVFANEATAYTKKVLIVVDYQVDFVSGGVFGEIEPAKAIEEGICEVIQRYRDNGDIIIYTMDTHPSDNYDLTREGTFNPPHCIPGTEGWELYGKVRQMLAPDNAIQVKKGTYGSRDLPAVLSAIQAQGVTIESVEFAGVSTTCRVLHNAIIVYNFFPELPIIFDERTTAGYTPESTAAQLEELAGWGFIVKRA